MEAPPIRLLTSKMNVIVAKIMLCSPFPSAPRYWEIRMAINKLASAEKKRTEKLPTIILNIVLFLLLDR